MKNLPHLERFVICDTFCPHCLSFTPLPVRLWCICAPVKYASLTFDIVATVAGVTVPVVGVLTAIEGCPVSNVHLWERIKISNCNNAMSFRDVEYRILS